MSGQARFESWYRLRFLQFRIAVNLFSLGVGLFLKHVIEQCILSFFFCVCYHHLPLQNYNLTMYQEKGKINSKRGRDMCHIQWLWHLGLDWILTYRVLMSHNYLRWMGYMRCWYFLTTIISWYWGVKTELFYSNKLSLSLRTMQLNTNVIWTRACQGKAAFVEHCCPLVLFRV